MFPAFNILYICEISFYTATAYVVAISLSFLPSFDLFFSHVYLLLVSTIKRKKNQFDSEINKIDSINDRKQNRKHLGT